MAATYTNRTGSETNLCTILLPASIVAGDFLGVIVSVDSNAGIVSATDDTTDVWAGSFLNTGTQSGGFWYKFADGDEDGLNLVVTHTGGVEGWAATIIHIPVADLHGTPACEIGAWTGGTTTTAPDMATSTTHAWGVAAPTRYYCVMANNGANQIADPAAPTGYTLVAHYDAGGTDTGGTDIAYKDATSTADDPGAWTFDTSDVFRGVTVAVKMAEAAAAGGFPLVGGVGLVGVPNG